MKDRILQFLKAENKSSAQLAEEIGVQPSGISHILSGRNKPSLDFVLKMLEKYKFLSTEWLLFGQGSMYREPAMQSLFEESTAPEHKEMPVKKEVATEIQGNQQDHEDHFTASGSKPELEKIVWFFKDGSFREYSPGR